MREKSIWESIQLTFQQMDTGGIELECFQALQKQEQLAATLRINNLWEEVQKQKELERTLQERYGNLITELEQVKHVIEIRRAEAQRQEEITASNLSAEISTVSEDQQTVSQNGDIPGLAQDLEPSHAENSAEGAEVADEDGTANVTNDSVMIQTENHHPTSGNDEAGSLDDSTPAIGGEETALPESTKLSDNV